ncbi:MAG: hypothetical protein HUJ29_08160 [Gammaproteobacteria bacterium]|nr:hypothetical protein [Gammaproteobacteria bacterium]
MDENQYRDTYRSINETRCWFEKSINSRKCHCARMERFNLADREGVRCTNKEAQLRCHRLLEVMREKAMFALQMTRVEGPLPHAKEVKVQLGGMLGLQKTLYPDMADAEEVEDIQQIVSEAVARFGGIEDFPYEQIMQSIVHLQARPRRRDRR